MPRLFLATTFFIVSLLMLTAPVAQAEPVRIRAAAHGDSGRIAFNWDVPVNYTAEVTGSQLVVRFDRTIEAELGVIPQTLPGYVQRGEINADGQSVTLYLTKPFDLIHFPAGTAIVVDLIGTPGEASTAEAQPAVPETPTAQVAEVAAEPAVESETAQVNAPAQDLSGLPEIGVRTGRHADKLRVVFDWPNQVNYRLDRDGGVARLVFDSPARVLVEGLGAVMPDLVCDARISVEDGQSIVSLAVAPGARLRDFYAGSKMVLDVFVPTDGSTAAKLPAPTAPVVADAVEPETDQQVETQAPSPDPVPEETGTIVADTAVTATETGAAETSTQESTVTSEQAVALTAEQAGTDTPESTDETSPTALDPAVQGQEETTATTQQAAPTGGAISTGANTTDTGFDLRFGWDEPVAAAVFRRGGALWLVFDKPTTVDVDTMRSVAGDSFRDIVQLAHPAATILRVVTERGVNPVPRREGLTWLMGFAEQSMSTLSPVEAAAQPDSPVGARVFLPVPEPGRALPITDPEMGDNFIVVPVIPLGYGVTHHYEYPQFRIRPSSQGLVVEPSIDTLRVRPVRQGVGITSTRTLHISPVTEDDVAKARADSDRPLSRVVDFEPVQNVTVEFFNDMRQGLESEVAFAGNDDDRTTARLELIRFFLAYGMAAEALGILQVLADDLPATKKRAEFRMYRGMANFFMARYEDAKIDLSGAVLDGKDEGIYWRSLVDMALGDEDPAVMRGIRSTSMIPATYPRAMRIPLSFWNIDASVRVMDSEKAKEIIEALNAEDLTESEQTHLSYFQGLNNEVIGDFEEAIFNWETVMQGDHLPSEALAALARAELLMKMERISLTEAIEELEKLRFAWRGGDFEFNLLRRLGGLYLRGGGFREGLRTLRQAATYFREREEAQQVTQQMSDTFAALFLRNEADRMAPVSAIALYEEFKELTPVGELGDEMIRRLADRLVRVDLLNEASALLDNQIKYRLKDVEKARVGAQLAVVRILAKDYPGALKALELSEEGGLSPELVTQRRQLEARALMGTGRDAEALALIEEDISLEAEKLRTEAYWSMGDWAKAGQSLRELVKASGAKPNQELTQGQALYVLNYAIALTLGGNDRGLLTLRNDYRAGMEQADFGDAFNLIATPEQFGLIDYDSIAPRVRVAENFRDFMASYKQRLKDGTLSSIN